MGEAGISSYPGEFHTPDLREHQVLGIRDPRSLVRNPSFIAGLQEGKKFRERDRCEFRNQDPPHRRSLVVL